jgi:hypothetical protein
MIVRNRSGCQTRTLASTSAAGVPCAHGYAPACSPELWERTPPAVHAYMRALEARIVTFEAMVHTFQAQVRPWQERLHHPARHASRPPSRDPPPSPRPRRPRNQRRRGGPPGHLGQMRNLGPVEDVDEVVVLKPAPCQGCHAPLSGDEASPFRHQVSEMPPRKPVITAYQWHQRVCTAGGEITGASWPAGGPRGSDGPRVHATGARCTGASRLSKRTTAQVMDDFVGVPLRVSTIRQAGQATPEVVADSVEQARASIHEQRVAHREETRWRQGAQRAWLGVAVTSLGPGCVVRRSRGGQVARELLGEACCGILVPDRYRAYHGYPVRWRQLCWAHRLRDFEARRGRRGLSKEMGAALLAQAPQMFPWWPRVREGT